MQEIHCDIVIVGGSLGGVAAALSAGRSGASVHLIETTQWVGGQFSAQGVCRPDENAFVETSGSTRQYQRFRSLIRQHYTTQHRLSEAGRRQVLLDAGGDSGFAVEPKVADRILKQMLAEISSLTVHLGWQVERATAGEESVVSIQAKGPNDERARFVAQHYLDATDLGDLLPMVGVEYRIGAESRRETHEPHASLDARPEQVQPFTFPIALELRAQPGPVIPRPPDYDRLKALQNYSIRDGYIDRMFPPGGSMWLYRRYIAAANFAPSDFPCDLSMINTDSNDYKGDGIPTGSDTRDAEILRDGRLASLGYLYWLQTECPRDDAPERKGYPELQPHQASFDTDDGIAPTPYIRESRRILPLNRIVETDIGAKYNPGPRALFCADSCGIGHYPMDVHGRGDGLGFFSETKPYQIPLSALIPYRVTNVLAACKNIGATHLTAGAYRLHPIEWNIGEAAGALAAFCILKGSSARQVVGDRELLRTLQKKLLQQGVPLYWWSDVATSHPAFVATQLLGMAQVFTGGDDLRFRPEDLLTNEEAESVQQRLGTTLPWPHSGLTRAEAALWLVGENYLL